MCKTVSGLDNQDGDQIRVRIKFISPLSLSRDSLEFEVRVTRGSSVGTVARKFIQKYGSQFDGEIFDHDRRPYVNFIVDGNVVKEDFQFDKNGELIIHPPIGGG